MPEVDKTIQSETNAKPIDTSNWPLLLKNYDKLNIRTGHYTPLPFGSSPFNRKLQEYLNTGIINLDKCYNPSSHEVVSWVKKILNVEKAGHSGTLDPKVTGCLLVCLNRATRLVKSQQIVGKEYVGILRFTDVMPSMSTITSAFEELTGALYQRPPAISAVKRRLRIRKIYATKLLDFNESKKCVVFWVSCESGTYIRTFCVHVGLLIGSNAYMQELRRIRTGNLTENTNLVTLHDVLDAQTLYNQTKNEAYLRKIIMPYETLLTDLPRIVVKDSAVNAITYGAKLMIPGILRFENGIDVSTEVVLITTKGEAIAIAIAQMGTSTIASTDHGVVAIIKRNLMPRDLYSTRWGYGPRATFKKKLIQCHMLEKNGKPNEKTPVEWLNSQGMLPILTGSDPNPVLKPISTKYTNFFVQQYLNETNLKLQDTILNDESKDNQQIGVKDEKIEIKKHKKHRIKDENITISDSKKTKKN